MIKKAALYSYLLFTGGFLSAQTTAQDWTKTDCNSSVVHNLFNHLDNYEVVVMEFGMGCSTCYDAAAYLVDTLKTKYGISHPGRVLFFYMDYWVGNDCANSVLPVTNTYNFDAGFEHCQGEKNYYITGSPMPGIVIAYGPAHDVAYEKNNFSNNDTTNIRSIIDSLLNLPVSGIADPPASEYFSLFPNPGNGNFNLSCSWLTESVYIKDIAGKTVYTLSGLLQKDISLHLSGELSKGIYFIGIVSGNREKIFRFVVGE